MPLLPDSTHIVFIISIIIFLSNSFAYLCAAWPLPDHHGDEEVSWCHLLSSWISILQIHFITHVWNDVVVIWIFSVVNGLQHLVLPGRRFPPPLQLKLCRCSSVRADLTSVVQIIPDRDDEDDIQRRFDCFSPPVLTPPVQISPSDVTNVVVSLQCVNKSREE